MKPETLALAGTTPGVQVGVTAWRFGVPGRGPKAYIQAALHADEVPAVLVAQQLRTLLAAEEAAGRLLGEVVLVPCANPLGLGQVVLGQHLGRFDQRDGLNFNRHVPDLSDAAEQALRGTMTGDAATNDRLVRQALRDAAAALQAREPAADLKNRLLLWAADAHTVLDLHCDSEAVLHLYALTPQADLAAELGALMGAQAILLATESGDQPFDEACSRPWLQLQQRLAPHPLPLGCFASTVELRGQADTEHGLAQQDAAALVEFLRRRGVLSGAPQPLPAVRCQATPLAASEPIIAPAAGVVVFRQAVGAQVQAGDVIADLVDAATGDVQPLRAQSAGVLYARTATRWALPGQRLAKIAGSTLARTGKLLSP